MQSVNDAHVNLRYQGICVLWAVKSINYLIRNSADVYEQAVVKPVAGFFRRSPKHLFGINPVGGGQEATYGGAPNH